MSMEDDAPVFIYPQILQFCKLSTETLPSACYSRTVVVTVQRVPPGTSEALLVPGGDGKKDRYGRLPAYVETERDGDPGAGPIA